MRERKCNRQQGGGIPSDDAASNHKNFSLLHIEVRGNQDRIAFRNFVFDSGLAVSKR
jgi:hypothetical protein